MQQSAATNASDLGIRLLLPVSLPAARSPIVAPKASTKRIGKPTLIAEGKESQCATGRCDLSDLVASRILVDNRRATPPPTQKAPHGDREAGSHRSRSAVQPLADAQRRQMVLHPQRVTRGVARPDEHGRGSDLRLARSDAGCARAAADPQCLVTT